MKGILTINRNIMRLSGKVSLNKLAKQSNVIAFKSDSTNDEGGGGGITVFHVCGIDGCASNLKYRETLFKPVMDLLSIPVSECIKLFLVPASVIKVMACKLIYGVMHINDPSLLNRQQSVTYH